MLNKAEQELEIKNSEFCFLFNLGKVSAQQFLMLSFVGCFVKYPL